MIYSTWGLNAREARRNAGLTQKQLSIKSGVSLSTIVNFEADRHMPSITAVAWLAMTIGITIDEYINGKDN